MNAAIIIDHVTKRFHNTLALDRVHFEIPQGRIFGLLGPNGAGKTTLMRILVGILGPDEGCIRFAGESSRRIKERIGYLPEERGLYAKMKVKHLLRYFAAIKGISTLEFNRRIDECLERVGLSGQEQKKTMELSKGNQQRVQLLMTLLHRPDFLVLDEPFTGLDPIGAQRMKEIFREETQRGATVVISTHRMEDAEELCSEIALIHRGRVIRGGSLERIKQEEGKDEVCIQYDGHLPALPPLPGVTLINREDRCLRLQINHETPLPEMIRKYSPCIDIHGVQRFQPTLHDIFVNLVKREEESS